MQVEVSDFTHANWKTAWIRENIEAGPLNIGNQIINRRECLTSSPSKALRWPTNIQCTIEKCQIRIFVFKFKNYIR